MNTGDQLPLWDAPREAVKRPAPAPSSARYTRIRPTRRMLCDDCCLDIHKLGQALAPYPRRALWRRRCGVEKPMVLCGPHKDERTQNESH